MNSDTAGVETIYINSSPSSDSLHHSVTLDCDMRLVRVSQFSASSASALRRKRNSTSLISSDPTSPPKVAGTADSISTALRGCSGDSTMFKSVPKSSLFGAITRQSVDADENVERNVIRHREALEEINGLTKPKQSGRKLRQLLVGQLEVIQKQSEEILDRDRKLRKLKQENRSLRLKLAKFEDIIQVKQRTTTTTKKHKAETLLSTADKSVETTDELQEGHDDTKLRKGKTKNSCSVHKKEEHVCLETTEPYFTFQGEEYCAAERANIKHILSQSEVPKWRVVATQPSCSSVETECLDDDAFVKRHDKLELQEKRCKKWDMQRLRQQRKVQRRQLTSDGDTHSAVRDAGKIASKLSAGVGHSNPDGGIGDCGHFHGCLKTFQPDPSEVSHIFVDEKLPVSAFGCLLPDLLPHSVEVAEQYENFALPWSPPRTRQSRWKDKSSSTKINP